MRVCLIPLKTEIRNPLVNLERVKQRLEEANQYQPDLVCFPECTFTGYLYEEEDFRRFAEPIPGPIVEEMARLARSHKVYLCFGLLEATKKGVYNSAVLLDREGRVIHRHRKVNEKPPFLNGDNVGSVDTEIGRLGILICGDLFSDEVIGKLDSSLQLLIVPMSRSFDSHSPDAERWLREERQAYLEAVKKAGRTSVIVNALEDVASDGAFGGAMVVSANGELLAESAHGTDEMLVYDFVWPMTAANQRFQPTALRFAPRCG